MDVNLLLSNLTSKKQEISYKKSIILLLFGRQIHHMQHHIHKIAILWVSVPFETFLRPKANRFHHKLFKNALILDMKPSLITLTSKSS